MACTPRYYPDALTVREARVIRHALALALGDAPTLDPPPNRSELRTLQVKLRYAERMEETG